MVCYKWTRVVAKYGILVEPVFRNLYTFMLFLVVMMDKNAVCVGTLE
jgi:hypothetical protein